MKRFWGMLNYLGYLAAIVGTLCSDLDSENKIILASALLLGMFFTSFVIEAFKSNTLTYGGLLVHAIIIYFNFGFVWKVLLLLFLYDESWIAELVSRNSVGQYLPEAFLVSLVGYSATLLVFLAFRRYLLSKFEIKFSTQVRFSLTLPLQLIVLLLLLAKFYLMTEYQIGVMGDKPKDLGIPYLSGFFSLFMDANYRFLISLLILYIVQSSSWGQKIAVVLFTLTDIALGTGVGASKHVIVYYVLTLLFILYYMGKSSRVDGGLGTVRSNRMLLMMTVSIGLLLVFSYPYMNMYRYYSVYQHNGIESALNYIQLAEAESGNILMQLSNRVNGIENFEVGTLLMNAGSANEYTFADFLNGEIAYKFAEKVTDSSTLFGLTEFGYMYIYGGVMFVLLCSLALGLILTAGLYMVCLASRIAEIRFLSFVGYLIMVINLLMGAGDLLLVLKEYLVYLFFVFYSDRWFSKRAKAGNERYIRLSFKGM